jgi:hypothetical protein
MKTTWTIHLLAVIKGQVNLLAPPFGSLQSENYLKAEEKKKQS